jgi:class 3 adenylate cyclase
MLGLYLEALSRIIQQNTRGTIDKYIGDAIMTIWNAPEPVPDHGVPRGTGLPRRCAISRANTRMAQISCLRKLVTC